MYAVANLDKMIHFNRKYNLKNPVTAAVSSLDAKKCAFVVLIFKYFLCVRPQGTKVQNQHKKITQNKSMFCSHFCTALQIFYATFNSKMIDFKCMILKL